MKVVLLDNIRGIGQVGDIKDVTDGYARNFLYPKHLAKPATPGAIKDANALREKNLQSQALERTQAEQLATRLAGTVVTISAKANEQGTLFAGIEADQIADATSKIVGVRLSPHQIRLDTPIKTTGTHPVTVELFDGVTSEIAVEITPQ